MDALLAFAASLVALRLAAELVRRRARTRAPELGWWAASLAAFAVASAALAWGAAAGWDDRSFRLYYLTGGLLTAALLGAGSLVRIGWSWVAPVALVYVGLAIGDRRRGAADGRGRRDVDPRRAGASRRRSLRDCSRSSATRSARSRPPVSRVATLASPPARERAAPRRDRRRRARQRAGGARGGRVGRVLRRRLGAPLRRLRDQSLGGSFSARISAVGRACAASLPAPPHERE